MDVNINISKFNPKTIEKRRMDGNPPTCVFIGKRGTGKSTLVADILYHCKKIPLGIVMSGTEEGNEYYQQHIPDSFIFGDYHADQIQKVIDRQRKVIKEKNKGENNDVFVLLDDCMYDKKMIKDKNIRGIFMNGRHWKIMFFLTMQYCMDLPPDLRANIDYIFVLRENIIQTQKKLYDKFFGIFPDFSTFQGVMNKCTENFDCLVLDNTSRSNQIEKCVYWYRAKPNRKFKIGHKDLWKAHKAHYDKDHRTRMEGPVDTKKITKNKLVVTKKGIKK